MGDPRPPVLRSLAVAQPLPGPGGLCHGRLFLFVAAPCPNAPGLLPGALGHGLGHVVHERLYALELTADGDVHLQEPSLLGNCTPTTAPTALPPVATLPEATAWLHIHALTPFLAEVQAERQAEACVIPASPGSPSFWQHVSPTLSSPQQTHDPHVQPIPPPPVAWTVGNPQAVRVPRPEACTHGEDVSPTVTLCSTSRSQRWPASAV